MRSFLLSSIEERVKLRGTVIDSRGVAQEEGTDNQDFSRMVRLATRSR
jgi:hypothetical protein